VKENWRRRMKNTFEVSNPRSEIVLFTVHLSWLLCSPCFLKKTENRFWKHLKDVSIFCVFLGFCFHLFLFSKHLPKRPNRIWNMFRCFENRKPVSKISVESLLNDYKRVESFYARRSGPRFSPNATVEVPGAWWFRGMFLPKALGGDWGGGQEICVGFSEFWNFWPKY
jgi:hypothetical protein